MVIEINRLDRGTAEEQPVGAHQGGVSVTLGHSQHGWMATESQGGNQL